jgi:hypothetical protein
MKQILFIATILLITTNALISCSKNPGTYSTVSSSPPPPTITDTLSGKEFSFSDLAWDYWLDDFNELYTSIENRPDLFSHDRLMVVSVKSVTDSTWITALKYNHITSPGYVYSIYKGGLYVLPYPYVYPGSGNTLVGTKASLKVRFL